MRLFPYQIGDAFSINDFEVNMCFYYESHQALQWINDCLDSYRPTGFPLRKKCIYTFNRPGHSFFFLAREPSITDHCYEIEMNANGGFPMMLTGRMNAHRNNADVLRAIADEYWHPTRD